MLLRASLDRKSKRADHQSGGHYFGKIYYFSKILTFFELFLKFAILFVGNTPPDHYQTWSHKHVEPGFASQAPRNQLELVEGALEYFFEILTFFELFLKFAILFPRNTPQHHSPSHS